MTQLIDLWLETAHEAHALRAQLAYLEEAWLRAEADADYWYFQACNTPRPFDPAVAAGNEEATAQVGPNVQLHTSPAPQ